MSEDFADLSDQEGDDQKEDVPDLALSKETVADNLSVLAKTGGGLAHAYMRLDLHDQQLTDISILKTYSHLRYVDLSGNSLNDISALKGMTHLLVLNVENNLLTSAELTELPFLQVASFANNRISSLTALCYPQLEQLNLNENQITEVSGLERLKNLRVLEMRENRLASTRGICNLPKLQKLYLAANSIEALNDISTLPSLQILHLRKNKLITLNGFTEEMLHLQYINLRANEGLQQMSEVAKLKCLPNLRALLLKGCAVEDTPDYRIEVLINLRSLERLDKDNFNDEDRLDAEQMLRSRKADEPAEENEEQNGGP